MYYKRTSFNEKYGKSSDTELLDDILRIYDYILLEDNEGVVYRMDNISMEVERCDIQDLVNFFIEKQEDVMDINAEEYQEKKLFELRTFCINQFGGFHSERIKYIERCEKEREEEKEKEELYLNIVYNNIELGNVGGFSFHLSEFNYNKDNIIQFVRTFFNRVSYIDSKSIYSIYNVDDMNAYLETIDFNNTTSHTYSTGGMEAIVGISNKKEYRNSSEEELFRLITKGLKNDKEIEFVKSLMDVAKVINYENNELIIK